MHYVATQDPLTYFRGDKAKKIEINNFVEKKVPKWPTHKSWVFRNRQQGCPLKLHLNTLTLFLPRGADSAHHHRLKIKPDLKDQPIRKQDFEIWIFLYADHNFIYSCWYLFYHIKSSWILTNEYETQ